MLVTLAAAAVLVAPVAPPERPTFTAVSPGGDPVRGALVAIGPGWTATLQTDAGGVSVRYLISLRPFRRPRPPWPTGPALFTTAGDRVCGAVVGGRGEAVRFRPDFAPGGREWVVPATVASAVWLAAQPADTPADPARYAWLSDARRRDVLLLRNGDLLRGTIAGFDAGPVVRLRPDAGGEPTAVPAARVSAVGFDPSLSRPRVPRGAHARVVLRDGSRLVLASAAADRTTLKGRAVAGFPVDLPLSEVVSLDVYGGKATAVSALKPAKAASEGDTGTAWGWAADRAVGGGQLRLPAANGVDHADVGIGTRPRTTLTFPLDGKARWFEAVVGLDPVTGRRGGADVRVLVDGEERPLPALRTLTAAGGAVPVRVDVRGARAVTLVTGFGPAGGVQADVTWADARLVAE